MTPVEDRSRTSGQSTPFPPIYVQDFLENHPLLPSRADVLVAWMSLLKQGHSSVCSLLRKNLSLLSYGRGTFCSEWCPCLRRFEEVNLSRLGGFVVTVSVKKSSVGGDCLLTHSTVSFSRLVYMLSCPAPSPPVMFGRLDHRT